MRHEGPIRVGITVIPPQVVCTAEEYQGLAIDYIHLIEDKIGCRFELVPFQTWNELIQAAKVREIDMIFAAQKTAERSTYLLFTEPYIELPNLILVRADHRGSYSLRDMTGWRVATSTGSAVQEYLTAEYHGLELCPVPDELTGLRAVSLGEVDAMVVEISRASYYIEKAGILNLRVAGDAGLLYRLRFAIRSDWPTLTGILDRALSAVTDSERREIDRRWMVFGEDGSGKTRATLVLTAVILAAAGLVFTGIIAWNRSLRRVVRQRTSQLNQQLAERRETEEVLHTLNAELQASQKKFQSLIENVQTAIVVHDGKGEIRYSNALARKLLGLSADQLLGKALFDPEWCFLHEDGSVMPSSEYPVSLVLGRQEPLRDYLAGIRSSARDEVTWVLVNAEPVFDRLDEIVEIVVSFVDVTDRKQAERRLALSDFALNHMHEAAFLIDENARFRYVNEESCRILGYSREELLTMGVPDIDPEFPQARWADHWTELRQQHSLLLESRHKRRDGRYIPVEVNANYFVYEDRAYNLALVRDITNRKRAEKALSDSEAELRALLGAMTDVVVVCDAEGRYLKIVETNPDLLFKPASELLDRRLHDIFPKDQADFFLDSITQALATRDSVDLEYSLRIGDEDYWFDATISPLADDRVLMVARDITKRKLVEKALRESESRVQRTLNAILSPGEELTTLELADIIDSEKIQELMDAFFRLTRIGVGIIDLNGEVLVGTGWQDICTKFHRVNPESRRLCIESDLELSSGVPQGEFKVYRCKNNMWDIATPIMLGSKHVGNIFLGQFLFDDETPEYEVFREQAARFGFDEQEYLAALDRVPRWSRDMVEATMMFYSTLSELFSSLSYSNIKLARTLEERKRADEALRENEQRYRMVFENSPVPIWEEDFSGVKVLFDDLRKEGVTDLEAHLARHPETAELCAEQVKVIDINGAALIMHAATDKEQLLTGLTETFTAESYETFRQELICLWNGKPELTTDAVVKTLEGDQRDVTVYFTVCPGHEESLSKVFVSLVDITERKQAERERLTHFRHVESMDLVNRAIQEADGLENMMSRVLDAVLKVFDCDRAFLLYPCDPAATMWRVPMERSRREFPGAAALGLDMPMDQDVAQTLRILLDADGPVKFGPETRYPLPADVSERFGFKCFMSMALHPKEGRPWQFGIHQCSHARIWTEEEELLLKDIGRRLTDALTSMLAYENLQESEAKLAQAQRIAKIGNWEWDVAGHRQWWSDEAIRILDICSDAFEATLDAFLEIVHPEDRTRVEAYLEESLLPATENSQTEFRIVCADGSVRHIHEEAETTFDAAGSPLSRHGTIQDVTDRKQAEEEIIALNQELEDRVVLRTKQLKAANKELEAFTYSVAHDLRAPLRGIDGFSQVLLEDYYDELDGSGKKYLRRVRSAAQHMDGLIDDMLTLARISRSSLKMQTVDLSSMAHRIKENLSETQQERNVEFVIQDGVRTRGDTRLLRIVMENLLQNAWKFSSGRPAARIEFGMRHDDGKPVYFVRDNGVGFDMKYAHKLFGPFQRLHTVNEFPGTGIGLATVQRIIHRHGGKVWAEGKIEQGATFSFSI